MTQYIEREKLINYANNHIAGIDANDIARFPGINVEDIQKVKHGKWIFTDHYGYFHTPIYMCSNCKKEVEDNHIDVHKYCLHCGAKMEEVI